MKKWITYHFFVIVCFPQGEQRHGKPLWWQMLRTVYKHLFQPSQCLQKQKLHIDFVDILQVDAIVPTIKYSTRSIYLQYGCRIDNF